MATVKKYRFELILGVVCACTFAALWMWLTPGARGALTGTEVDAYIRRIEPVVPMPAAEKPETMARLRAWGEADDGAPVHMLNLMRYYPKLQPLPATASAASVEGTMSPAEANAYYEQQVLPILERLGGYPVMGGNAAGVRGSDGQRHSNLMVFDREVDDWDRVLVVRYPSRRAFFELLADPHYAELMPYKRAALRVALVPVRAEAEVPDPRWIAGLGLLVLFFGAAWLRALRRR